MSECKNKKKFGMGSPKTATPHIHLTYWPYQVGLMVTISDDIFIKINFISIANSVDIL